MFDLGVFLGFLANHWIAPSWFAAIYFAEIIVPYLGAFAKQLGHPFAVRWSARLKTTVHPLAQILVIAWAAAFSGAAAAGSLVVTIALAVALAASLATLADHAVFVGRILSRKDAERSA
jgi:phosphatidylglycerophosphate synthase